jgi:hypothetical protein
VLCLWGYGGDHEPLADRAVQGSPWTAARPRAQLPQPGSSLDRAGVRIPEGGPDRLKLQRRVVEGPTFSRRELLALLYCVGEVDDGPHQRTIPRLVSEFVLQPGYLR